MLKASDGKDFRSIRDTAILGLFIVTGIRCEEMATLRLDDLTNRDDLLVGKGSRPRAASFDPGAGDTGMKGMA